MVIAGEWRGEIVVIALVFKTKTVLEIGYTM
jgi:hypothetical protein